METREFKIIGHVHTDFNTKFGLPRQSGLVEELEGEIELAEEFRNREAVRGLSEFSHIWVLWEFSEAVRDEYSPTVRPPKLGGNERVGVYATRSPFRPNPIGMSVVKLLGIDYRDNGPVLRIAGIDMMDNTPVYDIKPYIPYADSHPDASDGFLSRTDKSKLKVEISEKIKKDLLERGLLDRQISGLVKALEQDPRPSYIDDNNRIYGFLYCGIDIKFKVSGDVLTVVDYI